MKTYYIKKIVLSVVFCFSLFSIYAQTIDVIYLKNGFDARGTITEHGDSIVTLRTDSGKTLSIKTNEIESVSQEEATFNPKVLIGRWACYKANGERDKTYDIVISENEGFYSIKYVSFAYYCSNDEVLKTYPRYTPDSYQESTEDINNVENGKICFHIFQYQRCVFNCSKSEKKRSLAITRQHCDIDLKYIDGKLKGNIDCTQYYHALGCEGYKSVAKSLEHGCGTVFADGPGGKWNVYFVRF